MRKFSAECWVACEIQFESLLAYENSAQFDVMLDVNFTHTDGTNLLIPAFWYEKNIFKVRFAPTKEGVWSFKSICEQDISLNEICGQVVAEKYSGTLDIYKRGFVKNNGNKYFVYNDGTPFFYIGDTHFGHENVIKFDNRPFKDSEQMDIELINRWNDVVKSEDEVYILGDFCCRNQKSEEWYLHRLNDSIHKKEARAASFFTTEIVKKGK